jgi:hypothetical protein
VKVFEPRLGSGEVDANVPAGKHRVIDGHLSIRAPANEDLVTGQVDLLQMKP